MGRKKSGLYMTGLNSKRKRQLAKLAPDPRDYREYADRINELARAVGNLVDAAINEQYEHRTLVQRLIDEANEKSHAEQARIQNKVKADYAKLIAPLDEYREALVSECNTLLGELRKWVDEPIRAHTERLTKLNEQQDELVKLIRAKAISAVQAAEQHAYEDLKRKTTERKFARQLVP